jgi:phospholipid/cholesterol/gamma-HCH transport system substrate-binding protein
MTEPKPTRPDLPPFSTPPRRDRELWVGLFVIAGVAFLVMALFAFTDASAFRGRYVVKTAVEDAAGLRRGDPVQLRGVSIGRVAGFEFTSGGVIVHLEIEGAYRIPVDSRVELTQAGLLGSTAARVIPGSAGAPAEKGQTLPGSTREPPSVAAERLAGASQDVLERLSSLLSDRTVHGIESSSTELAQVLDDLAAGVGEQRAALSRLSGSLGRSAANLERATGPELLGAVGRLDAVTRRLEAMTPGVERAVSSLGRSSQAIESVLGRIERGQGTLGRLSRDDTLYLNANRAFSDASRAAVQIGLLSEDIRRNPGRYMKLSLF